MMLGSVPSREREEHDLRVGLEREVDRLTKLVLAIESNDACPQWVADLIRDHRREALS